MKRPVAVIGGGFAGIAAATRLAQEKIPVILLEKRAFLGGRTISLRHRETGDVIDNGQHALMGCYHETFDLLRRLGTDGNVRLQETLDIVYRGVDGSLDHLRCPRLPGPLHLAAGLFKMKSFGLRDLLGASRLQRQLDRLPPGDTVANLISRTRQTAAMQSLMWNPITLSALNETPEKADARLFGEVLKQAFLGRAGDSRLGLPVTGLQQLHDERAVRFIEERGGSVRLNCETERIVAQDQRVSKIVLTDGEEIECRAVVTAVPAPALQKVMQRSGMENAVAVPDLGSSPILSVYLWFDSPLTDEQVCCINGSIFEWIFHRSNFMNPGEHKTFCCCLVASAADHLFQYSREDLVKTAVDAVRKTYRQCGELTPTHSHVFWERHATFSCTPQNTDKRLPHRTVFDNLYLAGDWTNTGLPATIEGAVQSGHRCAEMVLLSG